MSSIGSSLPSAAAPSKYGGGEKCTRCGKAVYFAERREGPNNLPYHKTCFTCMVCNKALDSTFSERQGDVYCKTCYGKEFGPKGFGYGASTMAGATPSPNTSTHQSPPAQKSFNQSPYGGSGGSSGAPKAAPRFGGGDICGRCNKTVYFAEMREGPQNIKYHKSCFTCISCNKSLDSTFNERKGDLYCKPCYAREYGPSGFGIAGVQSLPPAQGDC
jgi:cysteine/glycine-rich protein